MVIAIIPCVAARDILRQLNSRCSPLSEASTAQIQRPTRANWKPCPSPCSIFRPGRPQRLAGRPQLKTLIHEDDAAVMKQPMVVSWCSTWQ